MNAKLFRRDLFRGAAAGFASSFFSPAFALDGEEKREWKGWTICDHCNHVPSCGIAFRAVGNTVVSIENWKENPRHILCSKGIASLQRLYNPNRLLYPMRRTQPKGSADPGLD